MNSSNSSQQPRVIVLGAGIGGLATAAALHAVGIAAHLYEAAADIVPADTGLELGSNANATLRALGVDLNVIGRPARQLEVCGPRGGVIRRMNVADMGVELGAATAGVHRRTLCAALRRAAPNCRVTTGTRAVGFDMPAAGGVRVHFADGHHTTGDLLIGADGFDSVVRARVQPARPPITYDQLTWQGTADLRHQRITPGWIGHYWGTGQRFGMIELGGGKVSWWATTTMPAAAAGAWAGTREDVLAHYDGWASEVRAAIEATPRSALVAEPARDRDFGAEWGYGPVTMLGDAAHPMLPGLNHGAAAAIEDAYVLAHSLALQLNGDRDLVAALRHYEHRRIPRTRRLVEESRRLARTGSITNPVLRRGRDIAIGYSPNGLIRRITMDPMRFRVEPLPTVRTGGPARYSGSQGLLR
ncbi:FAD-dependent oxidoreductase [Nocardia thailandica]